MIMSKFHAVVDKYITDPDFQAEFRADASRALESMGCKVPPEVAEALGNIDIDGLEKLARLLPHTDCC